MNDVLAKWRPALDASKFQKGEVSEAVWKLFMEIVELAHASEHWSEERRENIRWSKHSTLKPREKRDYERLAEIAGTLYFRAKFLAAENVFKMVRLADSEDDIALVSLVFEKTALSRTDHVQGHENAKFEALALSEFGPVVNNP